MDINWRPISDKSYKKFERVLVFSPNYENHTDRAMTYRIIDSDYVDNCSEVSHWAILKKPIMKLQRLAMQKYCQ